MPIKWIASAVIAALLLTGTAFAVSEEPGQGVQLPEAAAAPTAAEANQSAPMPTEAAQPTQATTQPTQSAQAPEQIPELTREQAIAAALAHGKLTEEKVTELRARKDRDDGIIHWDVHWRSGEWEYDYEIHAQTGAVLEWDRDYEPHRAPQPTAAPTEPAPAVTEPAPAGDGAADDRYLTAQEAAAIALRHAGLTEQAVSRLRTELDRDRGTVKWEVEFDHEGWEYSYEIHAETGQILEQDKDWDD